MHLTSEEEAELYKRYQPGSILIQLEKMERDLCELYAQDREYTEDSVLKDAWGDEHAEEKRKRREAYQDDLLSVEILAYTEATKRAIDWFKKYK